MFEGIVVGILIVSNLALGAMNLTSTQEKERIIEEKTKVENRLETTKEKKEEVKKSNEELRNVNDDLQAQLDEALKKTEELEEEKTKVEQSLRSTTEEIKELEKVKSEEAKKIAEEKQKQQEVKKKEPTTPSKPAVVVKPSYSSSYTINSSVTTIRVNDGATLEKGLKGNLKGLGNAFVSAGKKYGVDPVFLAAIAAQESGWGKFDHGRNNIFGLQSGKMSFSSKAACIDYAASLLAKNYIGQGRTTPALIQPKYCPSPTTWDEHIVSCANSILKGFSL